MEGSDENGSCALFFLPPFIKSHVNLCLSLVACNASRCFIKASEQM